MLHPHRDGCQICGEEIENSRGYVGINFSEGATAAEQLRNGRVVFLCDECGGDLRSWLGINRVRPPAEDEGQTG